MSRVHVHSKSMYTFPLALTIFQLVRRRVSVNIGNRRTETSTNERQFNMKFPRKWQPKHCKIDWQRKTMQQTIEWWWLQTAKRWQDECFLQFIRYSKCRSRNSGVLKMNDDDADIFNSFEHTEFWLTLDFATVVVAVDLTFFIFFLVGK